jgi:hypothetical protein
VDVSFECPNSKWSAQINRPTINCWCYDLRENVKLRNMDQRVTRGERSATKQLAPRRYDLSFLVTAWARRIEDEHQLLWRALGGLLQVPILEPARCEGNLRYQPYNMPVTVAIASEQHVNLTDLWSVLDNDMRLGFTMVVTLAMDVEMMLEVPLVLEKFIRVGQSERPEERRISALDVEIRQNASDKPREGE